MNKSGQWGMRLQQAVSFSHPLARMSRTPALFWPGCALMSLDPEILYRTFAVLRRVEPELGFSTCCCGQPTRYLEPGKFSRRQGRLIRLLHQNGVERIYAGCPNCIVQLRELPEIQVLPFWSVLAGAITGDDLTGQAGGQYLLHDPCPMRAEVAQQEAVRTLLRLTGIQVVEPAHTREHTICCGNYHMLRATAPDKSAVARRRRIAEFPPEIPVTSYCEGCLDAFRSEGCSTAHVLELLFGVSKSRGWANRLAFTGGLGRAVRRIDQI